jgi:hypothetical protein
MSWLAKLLGHRGREYRGGNFHLRIERGFREIVNLIYTREGTTLNLNGELIGTKWDGIEIHIPPEIEAGRASLIAQDLATALRAMRYSYVIARLTGEDVVPETVREAAIAELSEMGYDIEVSADRKRIRQTKRQGTPRVDIETVRKTTPRMMALLQAVRGTWPRFEILARSGDS